MTTIAFSALKAEYTALLTRMTILRLTQTTATAQRLLSYIDAGRYATGCTITGVPQIWAAASFEREAASNFNRNAGQGWPLHEKSKIKPFNGPFGTWAESQIAAYKIDHLDKVGVDNWSWELACYYGEKFNGFGPRLHGIHTGYLWAGSNNYRVGKYIADGKWSATTIDQQLGIIPIMLRIVQLRPNLELPHPHPTSSVPPPPLKVPASMQHAAVLQQALNRLGADPKLIVDDSYGRETMREVQDFQKAHGLVADGLAGPATWAAINKALGQSVTVAPIAPTIPPPLSTDSATGAPKVADQSTYTASANAILRVLHASIEDMAGGAPNFMDWRGKVAAKLPALAGAAAKAAVDAADYERATRAAKAAKPPQTT